MAFELKVLDTINCPRCNGGAELRIDQKQVHDKWILVYIVCPVCRLNRYSHTTTRKEINLARKKKKLYGILDTTSKKNRSRVLRAISRLDNK